jgi:beta-phosphoglucomutase-like phosphatase (HAD superfamily)
MASTAAAGTSCAAAQRRHARSTTAVEDCIVVEDAPAGVTAAKEAGMAVIAVCTTHQADDLAQADVVCHAMADVLKHLSAAVNC